MTIIHPDNSSGWIEESREIFSSSTPESNRQQQLVIARDLSIIPEQWDLVDCAQRAKMIREYIEWILDNDQDLKMKQEAGLLTSRYRSNLFVVVEQVLPILVENHGENHREFPLLGSTIESLRKHIVSFDG